MKKIIGFLLLLNFLNISAQESFSFKNNIINLNYYFATAKNFTENGVQISYYRRNEIEDNIHIEYGGNIYLSGNKNPLIYIKNDSIYSTKTKGFNFDFGIKMVKSKRIGHNNLEWISELGFGGITFDRGNIPKTEYNNTQENTVEIDTGLETLSTFNLGQGLRVFKNKIGAEVKVNYLPIYWTEKKHLPEKMNMFRFSFGIVYKF